MALAIFLLGLCFGSFLNVVIYRIPKGGSLVSPGSRCPACGKAIAWYDNIPLASYIALGARCRACRKPISPRYFLVELLAGALFLGLWLKFAAQPAVFVPYAVFALLLVAIGFIDLDTFYIYDAMALPGIVLGLAFSFVVPGMFAGMGPGAALRYAALGAAVGAAVPLALRFFGTMVFKKEAMGLGDVELLAMIGAFAGWKGVLLSVFFGSLAGTAVSLSLIGMKRRKMADLVPFGPYLSLGGLIAVFWKGHAFADPGFWIP